MAARQEAASLNDGTGFAFITVRGMCQVRSRDRAGCQVPILRCQAHRGGGQWWGSLWYQCPGGRGHGGRVGASGRRGAPGYRWGVRGSAGPFAVGVVAISQAVGGGRNRGFGPLGRSGGHGMDAVAAPVSAEPGCWWAGADPVPLRGRRGRGLRRRHSRDLVESAESLIGGYAGGHLASLTIVAGADQASLAQAAADAAGAEEASVELENLRVHHFIPLGTTVYLDISEGLDAYSYDLVALSVATAFQQAPLWAGAGAGRLADCAGLDPALWTVGPVWLYLGMPDGNVRTRGAVRQRVLGAHPRVISRLGAEPDHRCRVCGHRPQPGGAEFLRRLA